MSAVCQPCSLTTTAALNAIYLKGTIIDLQCTVKGEHCHTFIKQVYKVDTLQFQDKLLKNRGKIFNQLLDLQLH